MATYRNLLIFILALIYTFISNQSYGKNLRGYTEKIEIEGLKYAYEAVQDQQGYLWFVNSSGVHRYDGMQLKTFTKGPNSGLSHSNCHSLHVDGNNNVWIGTVEGINRYNPVTETIEYIIDPNWPESKALSVSAITSDKNQNLWIATTNYQLVHYNATTKALTRLPLTKQTDLNDQNQVLSDIKLDNLGNVWLPTINGLYRLRFDNSMQLIDSKLYNTDNSGLIGNQINRVHIDEKQNLWLGTDQGLHYYYHQSDVITSITASKTLENHLASTNVETFDTDHQGNLWITTWGKGVHIINKQQQQLVEQQQGFNQSFALYYDSFIYQNSANDDIQLNHINSILADNQGSMWIVGHEPTYKVLTSKLATNHINFFSSFNRQQSSNPQTVIRNNISLSHRHLRDIFKDSQGYLWFASLNGLTRYHQQKATIEYFYHQSNDQQSLPSNYINVVFEDDKQNIWVGTKLGLARFNPSQSNFTRIPLNSINLEQTNQDELTADEVIEIKQDRFGILWIALSNRLVKHNLSTGQFETFSIINSNSNDYMEYKISVIEYDQKDTIWLGKTYSGIGKFDITTNKYTFHTVADGAPKAPIRDILIEQSDTIWIATNSNLWLSDGKNNYQMLPDKAQQQTTYTALEQDNTGTLWVGTTDGLKTYNPSTKTFNKYTKYHGLINKGIYMPLVSFKDPDGSLYFGGAKGIDHFHPDTLTFSPPSLEVVITDFLVANRSAAIAKPQANSKQEQSNQFNLPKAAHFLDEIKLSHQENIFSFEFNAFNYINPKQTDYQYRLKGFNDNWIETDNNNRRATFTNIPAGDYQFEVKTTTGNDSWSPIKSLKVTVLPPWWRTNFAYFIYILSFTSFLMCLYKWRTKSIIATSRALEKQVIERTKTISELMTQKDQMFANISHEFRTPLTLIVNPAEQLLETRQNDPLVTKTALGIKTNAERLLRMVEQLLEFAKTESNSTQTGLQNYSVKQTINYLIACFDSLFASKSLKVTVNNYQDVLLRLKPDSLEIILTNLISNAVKYSPNGGEIEINVANEPSQNNPNVIISVKDTGIGIAYEHQSKIFERFGRVETQQTDNSTHIQTGTGIGLALVKELVQANGGGIKVISELNQGSQFNITLPITNDNIQPQSINELSANSKQITALEINHLSQTQKPIKLEQNTTTDKDQSSEKPIILVIDDNQELLELISGILNELYTVKLASNGQQGVELASEQIPDLVITDLMMPIMNGFEVLKALKTNSLTAHIPVVMLTAKGDTQSRIEGWNNQADEYLAKPFNSHELLARVNNLLSIRKIISNRFAQHFAQLSATWQHSDTPIEQTKVASSKDKSKNKLDQIAEEFSNRIKQIIAKHYQNENLSVETIAQEMAMSHRQLVRKTKSLISMTPNECIRTYRLQKATELLKEDIPPSTIAYEVGFASHSYFAACFKAQFGCTPSQYMQQHDN